MVTNRVLFVSACMAAFVAILHTVVGTSEIHTPLFSSQLSEPISLLLYACWHIVTLVLILSAIALLWSSSKGRTKLNYALANFIGILWIGFGAVFIFIALYFSGVEGLLILPQWSLLIPTGSLVLFGARSNK